MQVSPVQGFKTDPDEKETERVPVCSRGEEPGTRFKTDPDEKGTESTLSWFIRPTKFAVSRLIPMKRELKVFSEEIESSICTYVSRPIPMKRELKDHFHHIKIISYSGVSRLIPMKRELKGKNPNIPIVPSTSFKTDPDEKGTESPPVNLYVSPEYWSFKTDPDEKGTESSLSHRGRWSASCFKTDPDEKGTERRTPGNPSG